MKLFALLALLLPVAAFAENETNHWGYEGQAGPEHWADLCTTGHEQSPIDLVAALHASDAPAVQLDWQVGTDWLVQNNGHTLQLTPIGSAGKIEIAGKAYTLLQLHFHHPAEHAIDGKRAAMEVHFVHKAEDGSLAVLGVMLAGGGPAGWLDQIVQTAPPVKGTVPLGVQNPAVLLPESRGFFRYAGSLTTPPCSEVVLWTVLQQPLAVSDAAIAGFAQMFPMNARPLQPIYRRFLVAE
jgi:carbonic anhydrase